MGQADRLPGLVLLAAAWASLSWGCLEGGRRLGEVATDTSLADDTATACESPQLDVALGGTALSAPVWRVAAVSPEAIYVSGDPSVSGGVDRVTPASGATTAVPRVDPEWSDRILDGRDGAALILSTRDTSLHYRDADRVARLTSPPELAWDTGTIRGRAVAPGRAAWRACVVGDPVQSCVRSQLRAWIDGEFRTLWDHDETTVGVNAPFPDVGGGGVVWAEPVDLYAPSAWVIHTWDGGDAVSARSVDAPVDRVVRVADGFVWISWEGAWFAPADGPIEQLVSGSCAALDGDGRRTVMLCDADEGDDDAARLWTFAPGEGARLVPTDNAVVRAPQVEGELLAWLAYPVAPAPCSDAERGPAHGVVRVAGAWDPAAATDLAPVWGPTACTPRSLASQLALSRGVVVWSFDATTPPPSSAATPGLDAPDARRLGWARVSVVCP